MSLLDDLKRQAGKQQHSDTTKQAPGPVDAGNFYQEHAKAPMLAAYDFLTQLVNQLNEMKLDTRAEYPFRPEGKPVALSQQDYKVFNDHITDPRQITLAFSCKLVNPTGFEVNGRAAVLAQGEVLDRFGFKYEKIEQKDARQMVTAARFKLVGPLGIRIILQVDEARRVIKLLLSNFAGPGTSQYHLKPEQLNEAFLDQLGKYILRQEPNLFKEELSEDMRAKLRQRIQQERQQREAELKEIEAARQAEEALRKQNSTTSQLKKAVSQTVTGNTEKLKKAMNGQLKRAMHTQVAKGKDSLKGIFDKLKKQTQTPSQTPPVQSTPRGAASKPPTKPAQAHQQVAAKTVTRSQTNPQAKVTPPSPASTAGRGSGPAMPAAAAHSKPTSPASPAVVKTTAVKKTQPPKIYNAPPNNPFLKPEPEPPGDSAEREAMIAPVEQKTGATPMADMPHPSMTVEKLDAERVNVNNAPTNNPFLKSTLPVDAVEREVKTAPAPREAEATMVMDISSHPELILKMEEAERADGTNTAPNNPVLTRQSPVEPPVAEAEREVKTAPAPQETEATMVMDISSHPELILKMEEAERANGTNTAPNNLVLTPESPAAPPVTEVEREVKTASAPLELEPVPVEDISPSPTVIPESPAVPPVAEAEPEVKTAPAPLELEATPAADISSRSEVTSESLEADLARISAALNNGLSDATSKTSQKLSTKDTNDSESKNATQNPFLQLNEQDLEIDFSANEVSSQNNDSKDNA